MVLQISWISRYYSYIQIHIIHIFMISKKRSTWASTRAWSIMVRESAIRPWTFNPLAYQTWHSPLHHVIQKLPCLSISMIFSIQSGSMRIEVIRFSTARTTPWDVWMPTAVEPSYHRKREHRGERVKVNAAATLMASIAYSTWNKRPSGLNVLTPRSYSERVTKHKNEAY